jgi:dihydrofolate reductase
MTVSVIAIVAANGVIGRNNALPWRMSTDLKHFKSLTMGHHMIMGRKTFESVGILPGRPHIVITRQELPIDGVQIARSVDEALALAKDDNEPFICGGAEIYRQSLHRATRMYITQIHADVEGDTYFPEFDDVNEWKLVDREDFEADAKNEYPFSFLTYERQS